MKCKDSFLIMDSHGIVFSPAYRILFSDSEARDGCSKIFVGRIYQNPNLPKITRLFAGMWLMKWIRRAYDDDRDSWFPKYNFGDFN